MGAEIDSLRARVRSDREALEQALEDVREAAIRTVSPARRIAAQPGPWLVAGLVFGIYVGLRSGLRED